MKKSNFLELGYEAISKDSFCVFGNIEEYKYVLHRMSYEIIVRLNGKGEYADAGEFEKYLCYIGQSKITVGKKDIDEKRYKLVISGYGLLPSDIRSVLKSKCHIESIALLVIEVKCFPILVGNAISGFVERIRKLEGFEIVEPPEHELVSSRIKGNFNPDDIPEYEKRSNKEFAVYGQLGNYVCKIYKILGFSSSVFNFELASTARLEDVSRDSDLEDVVIQMLSIFNQLGDFGYCKVREIVFTGCHMPWGRMVGSKAKRQSRSASDSKFIANNIIENAGVISYDNLLKVFGYSGKSYSANKMVSKFIKDHGLLKMRDKDGNKVVCHPTARDMVCS